jgi:hypothetical protein
MVSGVRDWLSAEGHDAIFGLRVEFGTGRRHGVGTAMCKGYPFAFNGQTSVSLKNI